MEINFYPYGKTIASSVENTYTCNCEQNYCNYNRFIIRSKDNTVIPLSDNIFLSSLITSLLPLQFSTICEWFHVIIFQLD